MSPTETPRSARRLFGEHDPPPATVPAIALRAPDRRARGRRRSAPSRAGPSAPVGGRAAASGRVRTWLTPRRCRDPADSPVRRPGRCRRASLRAGRGRASGGGGLARSAALADRVDHAQDARPPRSSRAPRPSSVVSARRGVAHRGCANGSCGQRPARRVQAAQQAVRPGRRLGAAIPGGESPRSAAPRPLAGPAAPPPASGSRSRSRPLRVQRRPGTSTRRRAAAARRAAGS